MESSPQASNIRKDGIYQIAANVAKQLEYSPNGDINSAINIAGGVVEYRDPLDLNDGDGGSMIINSVRDFKIFLSSYTSANRDRFTVVHELGHYVLHYLIRKKDSGQKLGRMVCTRAGEGRIEWEANWFAAGFLMPENAFRSIFSEESGDIGLIAERFGVSRSAAQTRADVLGLV